MHNDFTKPSIDNFIERLNNKTISAKYIFEELLRCNIDFYWHPLGFILATYLHEDNRKIRIHIWPKKGSKLQKPNYCIHNHIFDLTSWVLEGEIQNTEYSLTKTNSSSKCIYSVKYDNNSSSLIKTKQYIQVEKNKKQKYSKGSSYSISHDIIHSSERTSISSALTVLLSNDYSNTELIVVGDISGEERYTYKRDKVNSQYIESLISEFYNM